MDKNYNDDNTINIQDLHNMLEYIGVSNFIENVRSELFNLATTLQRPSVLYWPVLSREGDQWSVLYGDDLQTGIAGFGKTAALAMEDFDKNWENEVAK